MLKPKELTTEPESCDAYRVFTFWLRIVEDFIESLTERREGDPALNKK